MAPEPVQARRLAVATPVLEPVLDETPLPVARPRLPVARRAVRGIRLVTSAAEWLFGLFCLFVGLAALSAVPLVQFLTLGYLLEASARVARSGRLRDGFIGVRTAARIGGAVLGCWLLLLPVRIVSDLAWSASVIDPGSATAAAWRVGLFVLTAAVGVQQALALARGGWLRYFASPLNLLWLGKRLMRGGFYTESVDAVWAFVVGLRLPYYFWLGVKGYAGAFLLLLLPVSMLAAGQGPGPLAGLVGFLGAVLLAIVLVYVPFLQTRVALTGRFRAAFEVGAVRRSFARAPWAFAAALVVALLFSLPLYLLKIETVPAETEWLPGLVFMLFIFPARLLAGWAVGRAERRAAPRHWFFRWTGRLPLLPAAAVYVLILFLAQYTSWNGVSSLYEQHAFLLPVPFAGR